MKSMRKKLYTQSEMEALGREINLNIEKYTEMNFKVWLMVLIENYGYGKKRLEKFMNHYNAMMKRFKEYDKDGVFDLKFKEIYESTGLEAEGFQSDYVPYKEKLRREHIEKKVNVGAAEAKNMQEAMKAFKEITKGVPKV